MPDRPGRPTAYHLAQSGLDVLLLEKTAFPREKVCGDGLTPRAVKQLIALGVDTSPEAGWLHNQGLRIVGGGTASSCAGPSSPRFPDYGLVRPRTDFDERPGPAGGQGRRPAARAHQRQRPDPRPRTGRILGVTARQVEDDGTKGPETSFRAPLVIAADGNSTRLCPGHGPAQARRPPDGRGRPHLLHEPARTTTTGSSPGSSCGTAPAPTASCCPATAGSSASVTARSTSGSGILNTSTAFGNVDYKELLKTLARPDARGVGLPRREHDRSPIRGAALPMGFNRTPHYTRGMLLVGDAGGMVNPFNGEGIAYAMESGAHGRRGRRRRRWPAPPAPSRELALEGYPRALKDAYGGYYTLGRVFVKAIGHPEVMRLATRYGLPRTDADEVHPQAARQPHGPAWRRRHGPRDQRSDPTRTRGLSGMTGPRMTPRSDVPCAAARREETLTWTSPYPILCSVGIALAFALFSVVAGHLSGPQPLQPREARRLRVRHRADARSRSAAGASRSSTT